MRVMFYGTPGFAIPTLQALLVRHDVVAVVTQPDRPAGRGQHAHASAVKTLAASHGLPVEQPARLRDPDWPARLGVYRPDVAVTVAFGQILPPAVLAMPACGSINVHASLLPRYRGAAPIAWAIIRGERETGITTFQMAEGMDTGPILLQRATPIGPEETAGELAARLAALGAEVLIETLDRLERLVPQPQDGAAATLAPRLRKEDGALDWARSARELVARVRGLNPWPGGATTVRNSRLAIWRARALPGSGRPGVLTPVDGRLAIGTSDGLLEPIEVQAEGRRPVSWTAYLLGARLEAGAELGATVPRG